MQRISKYQKKGKKKREDHEQRESREGKEGRERREGMSEWVEEGREKMDVRREERCRDSDRRVKIELALELGLLVLTVKYASPKLQ